jgi:hypothetical protein
MSTMAASATRVMALLLLAALAACAGPSTTAERAAAPAKAKAAAKPGATQVQRIAYLPPAAEAPLPPSLDTAQASWDVEQQVAANVAAIEGASLGPSRVGELMTILYSGDPRDFVDCGTIDLRSANGAQAKSLKASDDKLKLARTTRKPDGRLDRTLRLDSRTTVRFSQLPGDSTRIDAHTRYLLTKEVNSFAFGGGKDGKDKWLGATRETIAFSSGERGSFSVGTTCIASGKLEQAILAGLGAAPASAATIAPAGI